MRLFIHKAKKAWLFFSIFIRWSFIAALTGTVGGAVGMLFHKSVEIATETREENPFIIFLLPIGGLFIVFIYKFTEMIENKGTDDIIDSVRTDGNLRFAAAPLIFVSTVITHLFGGSSGREGAALQLGGVIGYKIGDLFHLDQKDMHLMVMCGMSALFSALFGTPLTAVFFAIEVISVGIMYYSALIPCIVSSLVAYGLTVYFNIEPTKFIITLFPKMTFDSVMKIIVITAVCAVMSIIFCITLHKTAHVFKKFIKNEYIRIFVGGLIIIGLTIIVGSEDYNGAGMDIITNAVQAGEARPEAFILKIIFTAITIGVGFKGGEIVPTFFIGATLGCFIASVLGFNTGFGAAVGMIAMFCGVLNCPIASIFLSIELFGSGGLIFYIIVVGISYVLSGYYGLYGSQKIMYSKLRAKYININTK